MDVLFGLTIVKIMDIALNKPETRQKCKMISSVRHDAVLDIYHRIYTRIRYTTKG